jgi:hypothetical protein
MDSSIGPSFFAGMKQQVLYFFTINVSCPPPLFIRNLGFVIPIYFSFISIISSLFTLLPLPSKVLYL